MEQFLVKFVRSLDLVQSQPKHSTSTEWTTRTITSGKNDLHMFRGPHQVTHNFCGDASQIATTFYLGHILCQQKDSQPACDSNVCGTISIIESTPLPPPHLLALSLIVKGPGKTPGKSNTFIQYLATRQRVVFASEFLPTIGESFETVVRGWSPNPVVL